MRHRLTGRQLSRNAPHRHALMRNMSVALLRHETIRTTLPKAKELRRVVEPLITLAKTDSEARRRLAFARLRDAEVVTKLFADATQFLGLRQGGADGLVTQQCHAHVAHECVSVRCIARQLPPCKSMTHN